MSLSLFCEKTWTVGWLNQGLGDKSFKMILCFNPSTLYTSTLYINLKPQIDITQGRCNHSIFLSNKKKIELRFNVKGSNCEKWHWNWKLWFICSTRPIWSTRSICSTWPICTTLPTLTQLRASCTPYESSSSREISV